MNILKYQEQPIYCIADTHGAYDIVINNILNLNINNCIIIVLGDIGLGFSKEKTTQRIFAEINNKLKKKGITLLMLRGNHDDKDWFDGERINHDNVKAIQDYTIVSVGDKNVLCVGGAISIDRCYRIQCYNRAIKQFMRIYEIDKEKAKEYVTRGYWENEAPIYDEVELQAVIESGLEITHVATHTSPSFCFKHSKESILGWLKQDETLEADLDKEREVLSKLYDFLVVNGFILRAWCYGHFHEHNYEVINGTPFVALINSDFKIDMYELR